MACGQNVPVVARVANDERDVRGINDRAQLAAVERILMQRRAEALMRDGARSSTPRASTYAGTCDAAVTCASTWAACSKAT